MFLRRRVPLINERHPEDVLRVTDTGESRRGMEVVNVAFSGQFTLSNFKTK